jgi:SARP family transcriptional regulator, regulator of embCAB operon
MRYEMLGRLRIVTQDAVHSIGAPKVEALCTALLVRANHGMSTQELLEELWGSESPKRAGAALHVYVCQLRKLLRDPQTGQSPIFTRAPGYVLHVEQGSLDVHQM